MAQGPATLRDIVSRSYARAAPANKLVKLIQGFLESSDYNHEAVQNDLCAALLDLLILDTSALLSSYLSTCLSSSFLSIQMVLTHTLFRMAAEPLDVDVLVAISGALLSPPTGLSDTDSIPALLTPPPQLVPDIGGSSPSPISTLTLLLPLLRLCSSPNTPLPIVALTSRTLSILSPFPSPPLEVGVEASALLPSLPESVFGPLRNCLAGLMADITLSQGVEQAAVAALGAATSSSAAPATAAEVMLPHLPRIWTSPRAGSPIATQHGVAVALAYLHHARPFSRALASAPGLTDAHLAVLAIGRYLEPSPDRWLLHLLENAIVGVIDNYQAVGPEYAERLLFLVEELPLLLKWWKEHSDSDWALPSSLSDVLSTAFQVSSSSLTDYAAFMNETLDQRVSQAESEDELGGSYPVEGWTIRPLQDTLSARLLELGLLKEDEVRSLLSEYDTTIPSSGESLVTRLANSTSSHYPPVALLISAAAGAGRAFAADFLQITQGYPSRPAPDNLFNAVASLPSVLATLSCAMPPAELVDLLVEKLLSPPDDQAARSEDPQGALTRFGESVVLVETVAALYEVPLPDLLARARSAIGFGDLSESEKECMNGWAKALFGSDGIDDDILLSTAPADFCRLASTLIQQAISATAVGIIDRDTLHSGLSYFSQPLLSWSLAGIVGWLCTEVERNGLISGLHLDVLQNLIVSDAVSDTLLRVVGKDIARLFDPIRGLDPVFTSANIDTAAIRQKIEGLGIRVDQTSLPIPTPENIFRAELQLLRRLEVAPLNWGGNLLHCVTSGVHSKGTQRVAEILISEALSAATMTTIEGGATDPLAYFAPVLLCLPLSKHAQAMISGVIDGILPGYLAQNAGQLSAMATLLKSSLLLSHAIRVSPNTTANGLLEHMVEDIVVVKDSKADGARTLGRKLEKQALEQQARNASTFGRALGSDEELKEAFPALTRLAEA